MAQWSIIAHGGARDLEPHQFAPVRNGMQEALTVGCRVLENGGTAIDAVSKTVQALEDDPTFNAGRGSVRNASGGVQMDAAIMDGRTLEIGAVIGLQEAMNPICVARALLREKEILLAGQGAEAFARLSGTRMKQHGDRDAVPEGAGNGGDTVGCVARDTRGDFAAATSTGGLAGMRAGRVGDVPLSGCGFYADNERGAVSLSGDGEQIARVMLAMEFLLFAARLTPSAAAHATILRLGRVGGEAGIIGLTPVGEQCWDHNSLHFAVAFATQSEPVVRVKLQREPCHG